jgi:hypothetical protein
MFDLCSWAGYPVMWRDDEEDDNDNNNNNNNNEQ